MGSFRDRRERIQRMKIGDQVYLITDRHQTGAGIPCTISALRDSTAEVFVESAHSPPVLKVYSLEDILCSTVYTHSILNLIYQTYEEIQCKYGSILNLATNEILAELVQNGLAPQTARRCVELIDSVAWQNQEMPLRQWLESIRDFYHCSRPVRKGFPSPLSHSTAPVASEATSLASA